MRSCLDGCQGLCISHSHQCQTLTSESWNYDRGITSVLMLREPAGAWGLARFGKQNIFSGTTKWTLKTEAKTYNKLVISG